MMAMTEHNTALDEEVYIREAYRVFDKDNTGSIPTDELRFVMNNLPKDARLTETEIDEMLKEADADNDGMITYDGNFFKV